MRLLNVHTLEFRDFHSDNTPPYVVTSHRWGGYETTYKDVLKKQNQQSTGYEKVKSFCSFARRLRRDENTASEMTNWIWIDTCCINSNSSAEVSESINSMWEWYSESTHCVAHLKDVRPLRAGWDAVMYDFRRSEWFARGWTLQELLAPRCVIFVNQSWEVIGRKSPPKHFCTVSSHSLNRTITEVTGIPQDVLCGFASRRSSIPKGVKMAWAANRRTTKSEDVAYCLLGIFDVHMPLIYGEGEYNARKRLNQEIKKKEEEEEERDSELDPPTLPSRNVPQNSARNDAQDASYEHSQRNDVYMDGVEKSSESLVIQRVGEEMEEGETCPKCKLLLFEPVITSCNHSFCETCMSDEGQEALPLVLEPLDSEGEAGGQAVMENFGKKRDCPICETRALFFRNIFLEQYLQRKYPRAYDQRSMEANTMDKNTEVLTISIGNWHELVGQDSHRWTFFVQPSKTDIVHEVHIHLHESFQPNHRVLTKPPYVLHYRGWGYFTIPVQIVLKPGYTWVSNSAENGPDGTSNSSLRLEWTLDFSSYGGKGSKGRCKVKARRERRRQG